MKKTISIILTLVLLFSVLPLTTLTAGAYEGYHSAGICSWWEGTSIKWRTVQDGRYYRLFLRALRPYDEVTYESSYETIISRGATVEIVNGEPTNYYVDGNWTSSFSSITVAQNTVTLDVGQWLGNISNSLIYTYELIVEDGEYHQLVDYQSDHLFGKDLLNDYNGIGGTVKLDGVNDEGEADINSSVKASITNCNVPLSDLKYSWYYYDDTKVNTILNLYRSVGTEISGTGNSMTLKDVSRNLLGKYVRLVVTAEGYDGAFYSPLFYYPCYTVTVDGGTAKVSGEGSSTLKAAPGDKVLLNAGNKEGYAFDRWEVVSGGVTITNPSGATNAYFMMDNSDVQIKAKWKKALNIVSCSIAPVNENSHPSFSPTSSEPSKYDVEVVHWYNETDHKTMQETDVFEINKSYTLRVYFKAKGDYAMTTDTQYLVNGEKAVVSVQGFIGYADKTYDLKSTYTVSGTITSFLSDSDSIGVFLQKDGAGLPYMQYCSGNIAGYSFNNVISGNYTLKITKKNHVTRTYSLSVSGNTTQDVKICPLGDADLNGKVQAADAMKAYQHAQGKEDMQLTDYAFKCADVAPVGEPNGKVQAADAMIIYQQAQGKSPLF